MMNNYSTIIPQADNSQRNTMHLLVDDDRESYYRTKIILLRGTTYKIK
jgi:hypothetical protein